LDGNLCSIWYLKNDDILGQLTKINREYIVLVQFWGLYAFHNFIDTKIPMHIRPSEYLTTKYIEIKNEILQNKEPYNFIHYRYESDFTNYFQLGVQSLDKLIDHIQFKNPHLKIYIATSNIKDLIDLHDAKYQHTLLYKNEDTLQDLNFEQRAFIDYMFGLHSVECYGHSKSSFSCMLNNIKQTKNYYN